MYKSIIASSLALAISAMSALAQTAVPAPAPTAVDPVDAAVACLTRVGLTSGTVEQASSSQVHFTVQQVKTKIGTDEKIVSFARGVRQVPTLKPAIDDCMKGFGAR